MAGRPDEARDRTIAFAGLVAALAGACYIVWRSVLHPVPEVDFRFFWLAGRLWADGIDPYGAAFAGVGRRVLPAGNTVLYWFYPPQWWPICRALATMDLTRALAAWRLASGIAVAAGTIILLLPLVAGRPARRIGLIGLACGFALSIEPTANLLAFGQSAALLYLALCLIAAGVLRQSWLLVAAGLLCSTFKPQVGALLFLALLLVPAYWRAIAAALAAALVLGAPQWLGFGIGITMREFLANLHDWGSLPSNTLLTASGPLHLLARLIALPINPQAGMVPALATTIGAGWMLRRNPRDPLPGLLLLTAGITGLVPLHIYDMTMMVVPLMLAVSRVGRPAMPLVIVGMLLLRPGKIETMLGVPTYSAGVSAGLISLSIAGLVLLSTTLCLACLSRSKIAAAAGTADDHAAY